MKIWFSPGRLTTLRIFLFWNILLTIVIVPGAVARSRYPFYSKSYQRNGYRNENDPTGFQSHSMYYSKGVNSFTTNLESPWTELGTIPPQNQQIHNMYNYKRVTTGKKLRRNFLSSLKKMECDGKANLIQDLGVIAIVSGGLGTLMGIFSASYYSVLGNVISVVNAVLSFATGIPSAMITYLAATDRISYSIANVLSVLSFANTFYGMWSIDIGNKDIILSQIGNIIGLFSLGLSIITTFPEILDQLVFELASSSVNRREIYNFVNFYGCRGQPTYYQHFETFIRNSLKYASSISE